MDFINNYIIIMIPYQYIKIAAYKPQLVHRISVCLLITFSLAFVKLKL